MGEVGMNQENNNIDLKERAKRFSISVVRLYVSLPVTAESQVIGKQLLRSATSVGANTRAAFRGRSNKEFIAKLGIVIEEADESQFWLELIDDLELSKDKAKVESLTKEANELTAIFNSIKSKYKK